MKYKEYRMFLFSIIFFLAVVMACIYFAISGNQSKVIIGAVLAGVILILFGSRFNMKIFNDSVMIYEYKIIGVLPGLIEFKNIKEVKLLSKHRLKIKHKGVSVVYLFNAEAFYEELLEYIDEYKKSVDSKE